VFLSIGLVLPGSAAKAEAEGVQNDQLPFMKVYDEKANLVESYIGDELKPFLTEKSNIGLKTNAKELPYANFYNEDGILVNATENPLNTLADYKIYDFGRTEFLSNIWVGGSTRSFYNPRTIIVEPRYKFKSMHIRLYNSSGTRVRSIEIGDFLGGVHVPLVSSGMPNGWYSIQLVNGWYDGGSIHLERGSVWYE